MYTYQQSQQDPYPEMTTTSMTSELQQNYPQNSVSNQNPNLTEGYFNRNRANAVDSKNQSQLYYQDDTLSQMQLYQQNRNLEEVHGDTNHEDLRKDPLSFKPESSEQNSQSCFT